MQAKTRGGKTGYREHKRHLVHPMVVERDRISGLSHPSPFELKVLHTAQFILNNLKNVDCW